MMERFRWLIGVSFLLAIGGFAWSACAPDFEDATCSKDGDCFSDEVCVAGVCRIAAKQAASDAGTVDGAADGTSGEIAALVVTPTTVDVAVGQTVELRATALDGQGQPLEDADISWSSTDALVAEVAPKMTSGNADESVGVVTGIAKGSVQISAEAGGLEGVADISVVDVGVYRVTLTPSSETIEVDEKTTFSAKAFDIDGNELGNRQIKWSSTDESIAEVDDSGEVTGKSTGDVEIVAKSEGVEARASLKVTEKQVESVKIFPTGAVNIDKGNSAVLTALPHDREGNPLCKQKDAKNATDPCGRKSTWTSGAESIATVNGSGEVSGKSVGTLKVFVEIEGVRASKEVTIQKPGANSPPSADAGSDQTVSVGSMVTLDGSNSSDPDLNDTLMYTWSLKNKPSGSTAMLSNKSAEKPTFTADKAGTYRFELLVQDGMAGDTDTVEITANTPPNADAGMDQTVTVGQTANLTAMGSMDADGDSLSYSWSFTSRPTNSSATLSNKMSISPSFTVDKAGTYKVEVTVSDGVAMSKDTVTVTGKAPQMDTGIPQMDTGTSQMDTGTTQTDTGSSTKTDTGTTQMDTGTSQTDT